MKVMYEDTGGRIIWYHNNISIVDYDKFLILNTAKYSPKKIMKYKIQSLEVIPQ